MIGGLLPVILEESVASKPLRTRRSKSIGLPRSGSPLPRSQSHDTNRSTPVRTIHPASAPARASRSAHYHLEARGRTASGQHLPSTVKGGREFAPHVPVLFDRNRRRA